MEPQKVEATKQTNVRSVAQNRALHKMVADLAALSHLAPEAVPPKVHIWKGETLARQWLKHLCMRITGQEHSSKLTPGEALRVMRAGRDEEARLRVILQGARPERAMGTITPAQQAHIGKLLKAIASLNGRYSGLANSTPRMREFCRHHLGVAWPQLQSEADACTEALKSILWRELPPRPRLQAERDDLVALADTLNDFGKRLVNDTRSGKWGPLQWYWLHQVYLNTIKENPCQRLNG